MYKPTGRRPYASINFVTAHNGFTLRHLVSYRNKHNDANGEGNRDGSDNNRSWNCGVEGETDDAAILSLRVRQVRNLLATLLLFQGVPMLVAGDELGRTQRGNNNAYCQETRFRGWTGPAWTRASSPSLARSLSCDRLTQCFTVATGSRDAQFMGLASKIVRGSSPRARRCQVRTGKLGTVGRWASSSTALSLESTTAANGSPMAASFCCSMPIANLLSSVFRIRYSFESGTSGLQRKQRWR